MHSRHGIAGNRHAAHGLFFFIVILIVLAWLMRVLIEMLVWFVDKCLTTNKKDGKIRT